jgi:hypothetical protein
MDENYTIDPSIMDQKVSLEEIDNILDKYIDKEDVTEDEQEKIVMYILQLFYRSGRRTSCTTDVHEKYNALIIDRQLELLSNMGYIDSMYDSEKNDFVYSLTEKGKNIV